MTRRFSSRGQLSLPQFADHVEWASRIPTSSRARPRRRRRLPTCIGSGYVTCRGTQAALSAGATVVGTNNAIVAALRKISHQNENYKKPRVAELGLYDYILCVLMYCMSISIKTNERFSLTQQHKSPY